MCLEWLLKGGKIFYGWSHKVANLNISCDNPSWDKTFLQYFLGSVSGWVFLCMCMFGSQHFVKCQWAISGNP